MTISHSRDTLGLVESANSVALTMFGYSKSGIVGKDINMLIPPPFSAVHNKYLTAFLETGVTVRLGVLGSYFLKKSQLKWPAVLVAMMTRVH